MTVDQEQFNPLPGKLSGCTDPAEPHSDNDNSLHADPCQKI
jgi:hypothetical protein